MHPPDREMTSEIADEVGGDRLAKFTQEITEKLGIEVLSMESFNLEPEDYLDINHVNARGGREKLSRQLAEMLKDKL